MQSGDINPIEAFSTKPFSPEANSDLLVKNCPNCHSQEIGVHSHYMTQHNGERAIHLCQACGHYFSETQATPIAGLRTPLSEIIRVLKARTEGMGLNATVRTFGYAKNSILNWERRLAALQETLFLYALVHEFLQLVIEGDELYTKVNRNVDPSQSEGWTVVLMERASRFILALKCGRKEQRLFLEAVVALSQWLDQTQELALFTDGERRYSQLLFEICYEFVRTGKRGRPPKTLRKGFIIRLKNKSSKRHDSQGKLAKVETPKPEHPETTFTPKKSDVHANHVEAFNSCLRRCLSAFRRRTNTYAKSIQGLQRVLDIYYIIHNFVRVHFTTRQVPAVAIGILENGLSWEEIFYLRIQV